MSSLQSEGFMTPQFHCRIYSWIMDILAFTDTFVFRARIRECNPRSSMAGYFTFNTFVYGHIPRLLSPKVAKKIVSQNSTVKL